MSVCEALTLTNVAMESPGGYSGLEISGYKPGSVWKKYSFIHASVHQNNKSLSTAVVMQLSWLSSLQALETLHCALVCGLTLP